MKQFVLHIKLKSKMQCKVQSISLRYTYYHIEAVTFHGSGNLVGIHLEVYGLVT